MLGNRNGKLLLALLPLLLLLGCSEYGKVDQGRVVKYDKDAKIVTIIRDKVADTLKPDYSYLPPLVYKTPDDPLEMGPEPKPGLRMKLDLEKNQIVLFSPEKQNFVTIDIKVQDKREKVHSEDPLVFDPATGKPRSFPAVDKEKKLVSIYSARQKILTTFSVPEQYLDLPPSAWDSGDEVRIYYKEEGKSLRFMNISKTNIFKK